MMVIKVKNNQELQAEIASKYRSLQLLAQKMDEATTIVSFMKYYSESVSIMKFISDYGRSFKFGGASINERLSTMKSWRSISLKRIFPISYEKENERISKLKTERGKQNAWNKFYDIAFDTADPVFCEYVENFRNGEAEAIPDSVDIHISYQELVRFAVATYRNGYLINVVPMDPRETIDDSRDIAHDANYIISDGKSIDLNNPDSIKSLKVPNYALPDSHPYAVLNIAYILKKRAIRCTDYSVAVVLIPKVCELMRGTEQAAQHGISWSYRDYRRLAEQLYAVGAIELADVFSTENNCDRIPGMVAARVDSFQRTLRLCKETDSDLVLMGSHGATCSECSKYEGRVFSISGKSKRYPKLPEQVFQYGGIHPGCRHSFMPWSESLRLPNGQDAAKFSNKKFVDVRTNDQKEAYQQYLREFHKEDIVWEQKKEYYRLKYSGNTDIPSTVYKYIDVNRPTVIPGYDEPTMGDSTSIQCKKRSSLVSSLFEKLKHNK